jgi:hypothetical protein
LGCAGVDCCAFLVSLGGHWIGLREAVSTWKLANDCYLF